MEWQVMVALVFAVPVILFPVAFIWYLNIGHIYRALRLAFNRWKKRRQGRYNGSRVNGNENHSAGPGQSAAH